MRGLYPCGPDSWTTHIGLLILGVMFLWLPTILTAKKAGGMYVVHSKLIAFVGALLTIITTIRFIGLLPCFG